MADLKISQLSAATSLAGTEVVPVVQGGSTKKATIDQILAPASGKGINFAAAGGDTLTIYDEGAWTPTITANVGTITSYTSSGKYTRIGNVVTVSALITITNAGTGAGALIVAGLPFPIGTFSCVGVGREDGLTGSLLQFKAQASTSQLYGYNYANATFIATNAVVVLTATYFV